MDKFALGIFLDGLTINAALVSSRQGLYQVEALESFKFFDSLEQSEEESKEIKNKQSDSSFDLSEVEDPFGFDLEMTPDQSVNVAQAKGNIDVIIELLMKMVPTGCPVAFNLHDSNVLYKTVITDKQISKSKLKKLIWQELTDDSEKEINAQNLGIVPINETTHLGMVHKDPLIFVNLLNEAFKITHRQQSPIVLIDTIEFALTEYITKTLSFSKDERTAVILFSHNFTKIFFMNGSFVEYILPTIHTGSKSSKICETAFSKMLYELDFKGISTPQNIVLVGEVDQVGAEEFFVEKFPNLNVIKLETKESFLAPNIKPLTGRTSPFSVAIALAVKALTPKKLRQYKLNFLPKRVRERQSQFIVAWHGFTVIGALLLTLLIFFFQSSKITTDIKQVQTSLENINQELALLKNVEHDVDSLRLEINNLERGSSLIDSLARVTIRWTPLMETYSDAFSNVGYFSVNKFESVSDNKMVVNLNLSNLKQVALLERFINNSKVLSVENKKTEEFEEILELTIESDLSDQTLKKKVPMSENY